MRVQTIRTDHWVARLPEDWSRVDREPPEVVYFEAPDHSAGVYFSNWRVAGQSLRAAMQDAGAIERQSLPPSATGEWEVLRQLEADTDSQLETTTEYLNRVDQYRIVSRLLGRDDEYVRMTYHDYACTDLGRSVERSGPIIESLALRGE